MTVSFAAHPGMTRTEIARTFAAYLLGAQAHTNGEFARGPFERNPGNDSSWQLDGSNNYWLHFDGEGTAGRVTCRYPGQENVIVGMTVFFDARHKR